MRRSIEDDMPVGWRTSIRDQARGNCLRNISHQRMENEMLLNPKTCLGIAALMAGITRVEAAHALDIFCPPSLTATWSQAANGQTNPVDFSSDQLGAGLPADPTDTLTCVLNVSGAERVQQVVHFSPNTPPSACVGGVTLTGLGGTANGVPPFGGFTFRSQEEEAEPTYDAETGLCVLDFFLRPSFTTIQVSESCTPLGDTGWRCPGTVSQVGN